MTRGKSRQAGIPTVRCSHVAYRTQRRCRLPAVVGTTVCHVHAGTAAHIAEKAQERVTVAQLMQHEDPDDPRPLGEVMLEAVHNADTLMRAARDVRLRVQRNEPVTGEELDRLVRMSQVAHHLAETTVRVGVQVELVRQARLASDLNAEAVVRVLARVLDALTAGSRAPLAPLGEEYLRDLRLWLHEVVGLELEALEERPAEDRDPDRDAELVTSRPVTYPPPPELPGLPAPGR
jgi:hypothetical protein